MTTWIKYTGPFEELQRLVKITEVVGYWWEPDDGHHQFRARLGALLNWWPSTHTVTIQGKPLAKEQLASKLDAAVRRAAPGFDGRWIVRLD
jgi:hypothetical protein